MVSEGVQVLAQLIVHCIYLSQTTYESRLLAATYATPLLLLDMSPH